jgi:hypothetical protein
VLASNQFSLNTSTVATIAGQEADSRIATAIAPLAPKNAPVFTGGATFNGAVKLNTALLGLGLGADAPTANLHIRSVGSWFIKLDDTENAKYWWLRENGGGTEFVLGQGLDTSDLGILFRINTLGAGNFKSSVTATSFIPSSDLRLKEDIGALSGVLDRILALEPVRYRLKAARELGWELGFIAQEVAKLFPEVVEPRHDGMLGVNYGALVAPVVAALQELAREHQRTEARCDALQAEVQALEARLQAMEERLSRLE